MNFQHMEAYCGAGEAGLACYGLEKDCVLRLMHCSENATFLVAEKSGQVTTRWRRRRRRCAGWSRLWRKARR